MSIRRACTPRSSLCYPDGAGARAHAPDRCCQDADGNGMRKRPAENREELTAHDWRLVEAALAGAASHSALVTHWFVTPEDASVHMDEPFGSNERTARFVGGVVPTLVDQLSASAFVVAVPWDLDASGAGALVLVSALQDAGAATIEARSLRRITEAVAAPWWALSPELVEPPVELADIAAQLRV